MPSVTCLRLSDVSVICRATYFVSNSDLLFFQVGQPGGTAATWFTQYQTSLKIWGGFLYGEYRLGINFELIPMVKMETRDIP